MKKSLISVFSGIAAAVLAAAACGGPRPESVAGTDDRWSEAVLAAIGEPGTAPPLADPGRFFPKADLMKIGVYYYPEHWPESQWDRDLAKIAAMGFEFTHFGEFAWAMLEPAEGRYEFDWLDRAIAAAASHGLKVILCTPSACPPAWMGERYPGIYLVNGEGRRLEHGTRANNSPVNDVFVRKTSAVVEALARRYGRDERIWGWQIDNEPGAPSDYSPASRRGFQEWLKKKYRSVEALNRAWGGAFWSFRYDAFEQVVIPNVVLFGEDKTSPHAVLDFRRFTADVQAGFLNLQADILRRHIRPEQWITTNYTNVTTDADPRRSGRLDFVSYTMYPVRGRNEQGGDGFRLGSPYRLASAADYYRSIKGVTGVMELQPGQVNWAPINPQPMPGVIRMWLWHVFGGGGSFACTYRFRQPLFGSELYHDGIVGTDGQTPSRGGLEFARVIAEMKTLRPFYVPGVAQPARLASRRTAFLWNHENLWDIENHRQTELWDTWNHRFKYQTAVKCVGAPVDYVDENADFSKYPFLIAPAYQLVDAGLVEKWRAYSESGGHLILSCRTGQKDRNGQLPEAPWAGMIRPLIGAGLEFCDVLVPGVRGLVAAGGRSFGWNAWAEVLSPGEGTETLAVYENQFYAGRPAAVTRRIGRGTVTYIGVETTDGDLERDVIRKVYERAGTAVENYPPGVYVEWRDGFFVGVNYSNQAFDLKIPAGARIHLGQRLLKPAGVVVWME